MSFIQQSIDDFIDKELLPALLVESDTIVKEYPIISKILIELTDSPYIEASIRLLGLDVYELNISRGHIIRFAMILTSIESMWDNFENDRRIYTYDQEHPFEAFLYHNDDPLEWCFTAVPELIPLFLSIYSKEDQWHRIRELAGKGSYVVGLLESCAIKRTIPSYLSPGIRKRLSIWFRFVLRHEVAHIIFCHKSFLNRWDYDDIPELSRIGATINEYKKKAVEVDADAYALFSLVAPYSSNSMADTSLRAISFIFRTVAIGISCFDVHRRSVFDYYGHDGIYPLPEVRFLFSARVITILASEVFPEFSRVVPAIYEDAVIHAVRSFQHIGIGGGAFFVLAGSLTSLDDQFSKELILAGTIESELNRIRLQFLNIRKANFVTVGVYKQFAESWEYIPFGETMDTYESKFSKWFFAMLKNETNITLEEFESTMIEKFKRLNEQMRKGDLTILFRSPSSRVRSSDINLQAEGIVTILSK